MKTYYHYHQNNPNTVVYVHGWLGTDKHADHGLTDETVDLHTYHSYLGIRTVHRRDSTQKKQYTEETVHKRDSAQKRQYTEETVHRRDSAQKRQYTEETVHRRDSTQKRQYTEETVHRRDSTQKRQYTEETVQWNLSDLAPDRGIRNSVGLPGCWIIEVFDSGILSSQNSDK